QISVEDPLQADHPGAEILAEDGQGDVDDGGVEQRQPRAEHRGEKQPPGTRVPEAQIRSGFLGWWGAHLGADLRRVTRPPSGRSVCAACSGTLLTVRRVPEADARPRTADTGLPASDGL